MPARARASALVSTSEAITLTWLGDIEPKASASVMAIEYGSSPVDDAEHHTVNGVRLALACSCRIGK